MLKRKIMSKLLKTKNRHNPYLRIGLWTCAWWWDKLGVGPASSFFLYLFQVFYKIQNNIDICMKKNIIKVPKITWVPLYKKKTEKPLNFPGNDENITGGTCSSRAATVGEGIFSEILGQKGQILVYLDERISIMVVMVVDG